MIDNEDNDIVERYRRKFANGSVTDGLAHRWQESEVEVPGLCHYHPSQNIVFVRSSERRNSQDFLYSFYFAVVLSLDPTTNIRTHFMGTSTKDDDRAKILPGVEGDFFPI